MDSSKYQWSKFVPEKNIRNTNKMFFGRYLYRAELSILAIDLIRYTGNKNFLQFLETVEKHRKFAAEWLLKHPGDVWQIRRDDRLSKCNPAQLYVLHTLTKDYKDKKLARTRIEGQAFQIYTVSEEVLIDILEAAGQYATGYVSEIHLPANSEAIARLEDNVIFCKYPQYGYKVTIKDGTYSADTKWQIKTYLSNFIGNVYIPPQLAKKLSNGNNSYLRGYFYIDDLTNLTFLKMISSNFVGKIFKLEQITNK